MTLEQMKQALGMGQVPEAFPGIYHNIADTYLARAAQLLSEEYIVDILERCYALSSYRELVCQAARQIKENDALCLLVCILEQWVRQGANLNDPTYQAPTGEGLAYDFLHLFPAIPTMPESLAHLQGRNVPQDVIEATMQEYDYCVDMQKDRNGRPMFGKDRLHWISRLIRNRLICIERFKYDLPDAYMDGVQVYCNRDGELAILVDDQDVHRDGKLLGSVGYTDPEGSFHANIEKTESTVTGHRYVNGTIQRETITLPLGKWQLCFAPQDPCLRIHIPPKGSFDAMTIRKSFDRAREVLATSYPDQPYRAFYCTTWLLSEDLPKILKPTSNILSFQNCFTMIPRKGKGTHVFSFVFGLPAAIPKDIESLPEDTSLQKAVKQLYQNGGYIHEGGGFFFL